MKVVLSALLLTISGCQSKSEKTTGPPEPEPTTESATTAAGVSGTSAAPADPMAPTVPAEPASYASLPVQQMQMIERVDKLDQAVAEAIKRGKICRKDKDKKEEHGGR